MAVKFDVPFVTADLVKVVGVNNRVFALCQADLSKGVAEPGSSIQKQGPNAESL